MVRIKKGIDYNAFLDAVTTCEGSVSLKSPDVYLNLKSELCRHFALSQVFSNSDVSFYDSVYVEFDNPSDVLKLKDFLEDR